MAITLTARTLASLVPRELAYYTTDDVIPGLQVRVAPSGERTWSVRYRIGRRQRRLTLGSFAVLSLAEARKRAKEALKQATNGVDPAESKRQRREADTVEDFALDTYIAKYAQPKKKSWKADQWQLNRFVLPAWRHRLLRDVTRADVRDLLESIALTSGPIAANRVRALLHKLFNVALERDVVTINPVSGTRRPGVERSRDRVLTPDEIRTFWQATEALDPPMRGAWRVRLLTATRGGEVLSMKWADVDLVTGWWTIPASASKNGLAHRVPLAPAVVAVLGELRTLADSRIARQKTPKLPVFVFEGARGKRQQAEAAGTFGIADFQGHDLRRSAATAMGSSGVSEAVIAKILNHKDRGVTKVYVRSTYDNEKRIALAAWARDLTRIIEGKADDKVLPFVAAGSP